MGDNELFDKTEHLYDMLQGKDLPEGYLMADQPNLTAEQAFSVIWFLQEHLGIIPQSFEKCDNCGALFDSNCAGHIISDDHEDDRWYKDCGLNPEDIAPHEGKCFCDNQCEYKYLTQRRRVAEEENEKADVQDVNPQGTAGLPGKCSGGFHG